MGRAGAYAALYVAAFLVVVNLGYWGQRTMQPLAESHFRSSQFQRVQAALAPVPGVRLPVPWAYVEGLDWVLNDERAKEWNVYLLENMEGRGGGWRFPEYYAVAWLYKEPIATQRCCCSWRSSCTPSASGGSTSAGTSGSRGSGALLRVVLRRRLPDADRLPARARRLAAALRLHGQPPVGGGGAGAARPVAGGRALVYLVVSVLSYYPHFIPYINELVWDRSRAYQVLADSSLVLDQNLWYVRRYLRQHPEVVFEPDAPMAGTLLGAGRAVRRAVFVERFRSLRENFEPDRPRGRRAPLVPGDPGGAPAGDRPAVGRLEEGGLSPGLRQAIAASSPWYMVPVRSGDTEPMRDRQRASRLRRDRSTVVDVTPSGTAAYASAAGLGCRP